MDSILADKLVLLVEDEKSLLAGMHAWLRDNQAGFAVMGAEDGARGLRLIERHRPDLVVSDVCMPGMSGLELLLACRRDHPAVRFILMSAYGTEDIERRSLSLGAVRFLRKPVDLPHLEQTIVEVLRAQAQEAAGGFLQGISVSGFVQLLNLERQTLALRLERPDGETGVLCFADGELVHAESGARQGLPAALELLAWEAATMLIDRRPAPAARSVREPLSFLLMEAMRAKDEQSRSGG